MPHIQRSFYGRARGTAFELWRGSNYMRRKDGDETWGGFCVLRLALRREIEERLEIEARAAYASLTDKAEQNTALRAVYWDSRTASGRSREDTSPIKIPARFVQVPVVRFQQWLHAFDSVQTSIQAFAHADHADVKVPISICSLRVEADYVSCAFEKVWQVISGEQNELIHSWQEVWREMGNALQTCPVITGVEESFPRIEGKPEAYDLQAYEPRLTLP